jgi:hypothetical protein
MTSFLCGCGKANQNGCYCVFLDLFNVHLNQDKMLGLPHIYKSCIDHNLCYSYFIFHTV